MLPWLPRAACSRGSGSSPCSKFCQGGVSAEHMDSWVTALATAEEQDAQVAARQRMELKSGVTQQTVPASSNEEGKCSISGENLSSSKGG